LFQYPRARVGDGLDRQPKRPSKTLKPELFDILHPPNRSRRNRFQTNHWL